MANCKHCNKELTGGKRKEYCSATCRAKASVLRNANLSGTAPQNNLFGRASAQPAHTQAPDAQSAYIISHLNKESDRWENLYKEEKAKREKLKEKNEELEKKITSIENENRIAAIENAKPGGLSGLLDTPAGTQLLQMCAPLIQKMLEPQPQATPMAGTEGHQTPAIMFEQWFTRLSMPTRQTVWNMLQAFTIMPDGELREYAASVVAQITASYPNAKEQAV